MAEAAGGVRVEAFDAADAVCRGPGARLARVGATLLCAGGVLVVNEALATAAFPQITFGLTDGWWLFAESL